MNRWFGCQKEGTLRPFMTERKGVPGFPPKGASCEVAEL
jgi:hypothetical protein